MLQHMPYNEREDAQSVSNDNKRLLQIVISSAHIWLVKYWCCQSFYISLVMPILCCVW